MLKLLIHQWSLKAGVQEKWRLDTLEGAEFTLVIGEKADVFNELVCQVLEKTKSKSWFLMSTVLFGGKLTKVPPPSNPWCIN